MYLKEKQDISHLNIIEIEVAYTISNQIMIQEQN